MTTENLRDYTEAAVNSRCSDLTHVSNYSRTNLAGGITKISYKEVYTTGSHVGFSILTFGLFSAITAPAEFSRDPSTLYFDSTSGEFLSYSEKEAREKMQRKEEVREQEIRQQLVAAREAQKVESNQLLTEGKSAWEKMWLAEKDEKFEEYKKMSTLALLKFETSSKLGNPLAQNFLELVRFKLKCDECFNEAVDAEDKGNEKGKLKKYKDALREYNKALSLYQEAIDSCRSGAEWGEERFTEIQNYIQSCHENLQKVMKSTNFRALQQAMEEWPIQKIDHNSVQMFHQGENHKSDPYAVQPTRTITY